MKKILFSMLLLLVAFSCTEEKPIKTDLYIYLDFTEGQDYSEQIQLDIDKYPTLMNVTENQERNFGSIKIYPLHNVSSGVSKTVKLKEGKSQFEGNKFLRSKEINEFKEKLKQKLKDTNDELVGKELERSHIFTPLSKGIKKLNKSDADKKVILIYSDMPENSELANFHSKNITFERMQSNFNKACGFDDCSDISFYVVHPVDKNNDAKIQKAADFWSKYLTEKGLDEDNFSFDTGIDF